MQDIVCEEGQFPAQIQDCEEGVYCHQGWGQRDDHLDGTWHSCAAVKQSAVPLQRNRSITARHVEGSLCAGEGSGRAAPVGHHAARTQLMGCRLRDNEKGISPQGAGGGKHNSAQAGQVSALTRPLAG